MKTFKYLAILVMFIFALSIMGCGPKPEKEKSVLDTKENHFSRGMTEFERGNVDDAMVSFERAKALDPEFAEAYSGMALVIAKRAQDSQDDKTTKELFAKAYDLANKGISKNDKSLDVHIIKGRVITMERKGDDWVKEAAKSFEKATKLNPNSDKAWYYLGVTYKEGFEFGQAESAFRNAVALKGPFAEEANEEWKLVQTIERAKPGTKVGAKIALIKAIDRADLAVLLMEELKLGELIEKKRPKVFDTSFKAPDDPTKLQATKVEQMEEATDIGAHWAKSWVKEIIALDIPGLEPFPDHTFKPDESISKANYAKVMESVMIMVTGDESLATKYIGQPSAFPDVRSSHYAYNAIALMVNRDIMSVKSKTSGEFGLNDPISGADALLAIRDFQNALQIHF